MGEGPPDLVQVGIALSHVEMAHELGPNRRVFERIASFARLLNQARPVRVRRSEDEPPP